MYYMIVIIIFVMPTTGGEDEDDQDHWHERQTQADERNRYNVLSETYLGQWCRVTAASHHVQHAAKTLPNDSVHPSPLCSLSLSQIMMLFIQTDTLCATWMPDVGNERNDLVS